MTRRSAALLPRLILAADGLLLLAGVACEQLGGTLPNSAVFVALFAALVVGLGSIGHLVVARQPGNAVGWLFMASSLGIAISTAGFSYIGLSVHRFGAGLPGTIFVAWLNSWVMIPSLILLVLFVPLLFPTGRLPSPRWRPVAALASIGIVVTSIGSALAPVTLDTVGIPNPVGIHLPGPLLELVTLIDTLSGLTVFSLTAVSVVVRYRHGTPLERLQLRWFAYPATLGIVGIGVSSIFDTGSVGDVAWIGGMVSLAALPLAIGIAILRHRLLDIDLVIKRTLSYGVLSVLLVAMEIGGVLLLQSVLSAVTREGTYAVAITTMGVAALFGPLRRRVQAVVDRRFDRARYDASRVAGGFGSRLRDRLDLDDVCAELVGTAHAALRPSSAGVWVRAHRHDRAWR